MKLNSATSPSAVAEPGTPVISASTKATSAGSPGTGAKKSKPSAHNPFDYFVDFFSSLRLTVVLLAIGIALIFWGTLAQVEIGLFQAQNEFFRSFFVYWGPKGAAWKIPIFPAGYTVGVLLLINLVTAHFKRFKLTRKKIGIWLTHVGLILLLLGQLLTDMLSRETHMWLTEGQSKNYSESGSRDELAIVDTSNPDYDQVVTFPTRMVSRKQELKHPDLPFTIRVKEYFANAEPRIRAPMMAKGPPQATQGAAQRLEFSEQPATASMDSRNIPAAVIEVVGDQGPLGSWLVSNWLVEEKLLQILDRGFRKQVGEDLGMKLSSLVAQPQEFTYKGHTYQLALRPERFYKPFSIELEKFRHDKYAGTDIPKNFSSRIRLTRPATGEDREVLIYMNNPLRYAGETFYQASFDEVDPHVTILQVVRNPGWLTPYFACILVAAGLLVQFLTHLIGFAMKRRTA